MFSLPDESLSESYNTHEMITFLKSVGAARGITVSAIGSWAKQAHGKLHSIGLISVRGTVSDIILLLNQKLRAAGLPMMHSLTIEVMAREGVNSLCHESQESSDEGDSFNEAGGGTFPSCNSTGEIGQVCTLCKDDSNSSKALRSQWICHQDLQHPTACSVAPTYHIGGLVMSSHLQR
jgi:hypothetical protein